MSTLGERLAQLEEYARSNRDRMERLEHIVSGGGDVMYENSVRGRLHKLEATLAGLVLRRNLGVGLLKGWERFALVVAAFATAGAAWYSVLH